MIQGIRGREPWNRADDEGWKEILSLVRKRYLDINDLHLKEILEREQPKSLRASSSEILLHYSCTK